MIEPRRAGAARRIGDMVGYTPATRHVPTERHCASCGCRLRMGNPTSHCAPCSARLNPWTMPPMRTRTKDECPTCGGLKMRASKLCRNCREKHLPRGIKSAA